MLSHIKRILFCIITIPSLFLLSSCSLTYEYAQGDNSGINFGYSELQNNCFVADITHYKNDSTDIIIPSKFNDLPITELGGYLGRGVSAPFKINCNNEDYFPDYYDLFDCNDEYLKSIINEFENIEIENVLFKITLPSKLKAIENAELCDVTCGELNNGQVKALKVFRPVYYFEISKDNKYFYTKDGKLYHKKTDKLFSDCIYEEYNYSENK